MANAVLRYGEMAICCQNAEVTCRRAAIDNRRSYPPTSLCLMFFGFAVFGWLWEVGLHLVENGALVNRGVLHGPWLPIYGVGGVLMLILLKRFQNRPPLCFGIGVILCGIVEYSTSCLLEKFLHATWWDYSDKLLNLHGRIYLCGLLLFGTAGYLVVHVIAPRINQKLIALPQKSRIILCIIFGFPFLADLILSMIAPNMGVGVSSMV